MSNREFIDVRGLSCPRPVMEVKKTIDSRPQAGLTIVADSPVAVENIKRLILSLGLGFASKDHNCEFIIDVEVP